MDTNKNFKKRKKMPFNKIEKIVMRFKNFFIQMFLRKKMSQKETFEMKIILKCRRLDTEDRSGNNKISGNKRKESYLISI